MSKTKQFTIPVQNQPGVVAGIAKTLGDAKVNILALLGTAQGTSGVVQLVVEDARRAKKALDEAKITYQETTAEEYEEKLTAQSLNLNRIYATSSRGGKTVTVVYTVEAEAQAAAATPGR